MTTQYTNGQRVFCFAQSMFGCGSKIYGTVKVCQKHTWVILDESERYGQSRVRIDQVNWYTEEEYQKEIELIKTHTEIERQNELQEVRNKQEKTQLSKDSSVQTEAKVGKIVKLIYGGMEMHYKILKIDDNGDVWGYDVDENTVPCERSMGTINSEFYQSEKDDNEETQTLIQEVKDLVDSVELHGYALFKEEIKQALESKDNKALSIVKSELIKIKEVQLKYFKKSPKKDKKPTSQVKEPTQKPSGLSISSFVKVRLEFFAERLVEDKERAINGLKSYAYSQAYRLTSYDKVCIDSAIAKALGELC
jgi:hypothetical protein